MEIRVLPTKVAERNEVCSMQVSKEFVIRFTQHIGKAWTAKRILERRDADGLDHPLMYTTYTIAQLR